MAILQEYLWFHMGFYLFCCVTSPFLTSPFLAGFVCFLKAIPHPKIPDFSTLLQKHALKTHDKEVMGKAVNETTFSFILCQIYI